jgi:hypothetical protein
MYCKYHPDENWQKKQSPLCLLRCREIQELNILILTGPYLSMEKSNKGERNKIWELGLGKNQSWLGYGHS